MALEEGVVLDVEQQNRKTANKYQWFQGAWGCHTPPGTISVGTRPNLAFLSADNQACHLHRKMQKFSSLHARDLYNSKPMLIRAAIWPTWRPDLKNLAFSRQPWLRIICLGFQLNFG